MMREGDYFSFEEALLQLADERAALSSRVLYALSAPSTAEMQLFRQQWPTLPRERRRKVVVTLTEQAEANFELDFNAILRVTMQDEDGQVRTSSIEGLWEDDEASLIPPLVQTLRHDRSASARAAAASSLGRFVLMTELEEVDQRYRKLLRGALLEAIDNTQESLTVRRRAVESIGYLSEECVHDIIAAAYKDTDSSMRISAVFAMGRSANTVWSETVLRELGSTDPAMRYEAARACGELEVKAAVSRLIKLVADADREVQSAAIAALGQIGGQQAQRVLQRCLQSTDEVVQMAAEDALAELELGRQSLDLLHIDAELAFDGDDDEGDDAQLDE